MNKLDLKDVIGYVEENIPYFHKSRIESLKDLKLKDVLKKKNPYLFKAKYVLTASEIVKNIVDAFLSSKEETIFGNWLEGLAIFINLNVYGGRKSGISGIDLEFDNEDIRYIVTIKSGPSWANKSQHEKMLHDFTQAKRTLATSGSKLIVHAVNGCCYGKDSKPHKFPKNGTDYFKYCGQSFWEFISGDSELYKEIIEPVGYKAKESNDDFQIAYAQMLNKFTAEFLQEFCLIDGSIDWAKIIAFNSKRSK